MKNKNSKKQKFKYDLRSPEQFYLDQKKINNNLAPVFLYKNISFFKVFKRLLTKDYHLGALLIKILYMWEDLNYKIIENDKYGFKNSNKNYKKSKHNFIGDSYAEGLCI